MAGVDLPAEYHGDIVWGAMVLEEEFQARNRGDTPTPTE